MSVALAVIATMLVAGVTAFRVGHTTPTSRVWADGISATVVRVVDGDTVDVRLEGGEVERLRILGIDTPEVVDPRRPVQCYGPEASERAQRLLPPGRAIVLEGDPSQNARDRYGRRLAHLFLDGAPSDEPTRANVGLILVTEGYARHYVYQRTPTAHGAEYAAAEATARALGVGLWSPETCDGRTTKRAGSVRGA